MGGPTVIAVSSHTFRKLANFGIPSYSRSTRGYPGEQNKTRLKGFVRLRETCSPLSELHVSLSQTNPCKILSFCSPGYPRVVGGLARTFQSSACRATQRRACTCAPGAAALDTPAGRKRRHIQNYSFIIDKNSARNRKRRNPSFTPPNPPFYHQGRCATLSHKMCELDGFR